MMRASLLAVLLTAACAGSRAATPACPPATATTVPASAVGPVDDDQTRALRRACADGDRDGCDDLAEHWSQRELGPAAPDDAEVLREACEVRRLSSACIGYALMRRYGTATGVRDPDGAGPYFARLVELGDLPGYRGKPTSPEGRAALTATEQECDGGRRRACAQLGWAAFSAVQQDKDVHTAFRRWRQACDLGVASSCRWAGHLAYRYPEVRDLALARRLISRAAGTPGGEQELGELMLAGRQPARAREHFLRGCQLGSRSACMHAGLALLADACAAGETGACRDAPAPVH